MQENDLAQWPAISHETLPWHRDPDDLALMPKGAQRRIASTYEAALPLFIRDCNVDVLAIAQRIAELSARFARFDAQQAQRGYDLPALLLRSESSATSQVEYLTSSVRNVALAEVSDDASGNARLIAGNVAAMRRAPNLRSDDISIDLIRAIHRELMEPTGDSYGGEFRDEQVWIGGTAYSSHGALYVPPRYEFVSEYLDDLVSYARRKDVNPIVQAAILHAQFESIHPFIDGNGRTGRVLVHIVLRRGVLMNATLPISAGLLHNIDAYMGALDAYQQGNPLLVIEQLVDALELAVVIGATVARRIDEVIEEWLELITERAGSSIYKLPGVLVEQPVINSGYLASRLNIKPRATRSLIARACEYGILRPIGNKRRGEYYQADDLLYVLDETSSVQGIRRLVASGMK